MKKTTLLLLACTATLAPAATAQDPPPGIARPPEDGRDILDRVEVIVNEGIITRGQLNQRMSAEVQRRNPTTRAEFEVLSQSVYRQTVRRLLMVQGGHDLGFPDEQIQRMVRNWEENMQEGGGGVLARSKRLASSDSRAYLEREELTDEVYSMVWERAVTGRDAGPLGRPIRDRFVRPGQLRMLHEHVTRNPGTEAHLSLCQGDYVIQRLVIDPAVAGGIEEALQLAATLRQRFADGEEFDVLVEEHGQRKGPDSIERPVGPQEMLGWLQLEGHQGELADFATTAEVGAISEELYYDFKGREWVVVARLLGRPELPGFEEAEHQARMRKLEQGRRDNGNLENALVEIRAASFVWTPAQATGK